MVRSEAATATCATAALTNKVIHDYFDVAWDIVWDTIKDDLPSVLKKVRSLLAK
jgi:uncharacterized protein with HEPN domain